MDSGLAYKTEKNKTQRFARLLFSIIDPRTWAHFFKFVNYLNYSHPIELRKSQIGRDTKIAPTANFANGQNLILGNRVRVGANASLWAGPGKGQIIVGDDTLIAPSVMLTAANYRFDDGSPINDQAMAEADILVGKDVWIGYGSVILAGVTIGHGAIIGAGSIIRANVPENAIVAGNPATIVGYRRDTRQVDNEVVPLNSEANTKVIEIILRELPALNKSDLNTKIQYLAVDSFELISLRTAVEMDCGVTIPDREWAAISKLEDIAKLHSVKSVLLSKPETKQSQIPPTSEVLDKNSPSLAVSQGEKRAVIPSVFELKNGSERNYIINMPQMALSGLSESWLFKEIGDIHWAMITSFLQLPSGAIADESGDRLYATFTRLRIEAISSLNSFKENSRFGITSSLERYGAGFFFGEHSMNSDGAMCRAQSMSTFAKYGERGKNTSLIKGSPSLINPESLPSLDGFPTFATEYRDHRIKEDENYIFECEYEILSPHDINGVGLLYFAAYPSIFDLGIEKYEGKGFLIGHSTVVKDVFYFANSEPTETLVFKLNSRTIKDDTIIHLASLYRKSDSRRMAMATSIKKIIPQN